MKKLWIVGKNMPGDAPWEFMGVFDDEQLAIAACRSEEFFVGPADLNAAVPEETLPWPGAYFPRAGGAA